MNSLILVPVENSRGTRNLARIPHVNPKKKHG